MPIWAIGPHTGNWERKVGRVFHISALQRARTLEHGPYVFVLLIRAQEAPAFEIEAVEDVPAAGTAQAKNDGRLPGRMRTKRRGCVAWWPL